MTVTDGWPLISRRQMGVAPESCLPIERDHPQPTEFATDEAEAQPLRIAAMKPVGNYAYSIDFSDGHDTGIYTLDALRELGQEVAEP